MRRLRWCILPAEVSVIGWFVCSAWATEATERLALAVAATPTLPPAWSGVLHHAGHDRVPGKWSEHAFIAASQASEGGLGMVWRGEDWSEAIWVGGLGAWKQADSGWDQVALDSATWETVRTLALQPQQLLVHLARAPARLEVADDRILWATGASMASLTLSPDHRPTLLQLPSAHPVFGDVVDEVRWDWQDDRATVTLIHADADTRTRAELVPSAAVAAVVPTGPEAPAYEVTAVAPGAYAIAVPEAESRVLLYASGSEGVLFDAPLTSAIGESLLATARETCPDVTTWHVVVSHHHPHYVGGLRPWARAGAGIHAPAALADWLGAELAATRAYDPADLPVTEAVIHPVARRTKILKGKVVLLPIDADSGHTDAFVMSFLTDSKTLYVADLANQRVDAEAPRIRGAWPDTLGRYKPVLAVSAFPLTGTRTAFPMGEPSHP